jgi:tetratricopeptide (TPR) repeat protein
MGVWAINSYASYWIRSWDPDAHLTLGRFFALNNPSAALQEYAEAARLAPNNPKVRTRLAVQQARLDPAEMNRLLELNLKEFPDDAETHGVMAMVLGGKSQFDAAIVEAGKAVALAPDQPLAYAPLCNLFMAAGRYREAANAGRAGLRVSPYDSDLQRVTGQAFVHAGDATNASLHFAHAVSLKPEWPEARDDFGAALLALHQGKSAVEQFSEAVRLKPDNAAFHHHLALALAASGKIPDAINECRRALELNPDFSAARDTLKSLEANSGKP